MPRISALAICAAPLLALLLAFPALGRPAAQEIRGLWVVRTSLGSAASIGRLVQQARDSGFNTLLVQVRGRGDAYYRSRVEPRAAALANLPADFDPLAEMLRAAHAAGLRVHAWLSVNLVASANGLPSDPRHLANRHPEWLMLPRALAGPGGPAPNDAAYLARLSRWTRTQATEVEGLYASPVHPGAAAHVVAVVTDLLRHYAVDGVHLDYVRYPREDFDFGPAALREFRASLDEDLSPVERSRLDARARREPLVFTDMFPVRWAAFRRSRLTALVMRLRTTVHAERPAALLTAAVVPDAVEAAARRLQDWSLWMQTGLLDAACPMAYTTDTAIFARQVSDASRLAAPGEVWAGIGAYRLAPEQTVAHIQAARRSGAAGYVLFSYDSLTDPALSPAGYLQRVARAALDPVAPPDQSR